MAHGIETWRWAVPVLGNSFDVAFAGSGLIIILILWHGSWLTRFVLGIRFAIHLYNSLLANSDATGVLVSVAGSGLLVSILQKWFASLREIPSPPKSDGPWLLPCRTTHSRQFPKRHAFSYSYLQIAVKIGTRHSVGRVVSVDEASNTRHPWTLFAVSDEDYLHRGCHREGLQGKLGDYLTTQGVRIQDVPNCYLVTAPRFLGYSFNPVSFWYLYDENMSLRHMILEVNNTFDERRMYFVDRDGSPEIQERQPPDDKLKHSWPKDFHVSPFSSRKGSYSLLAHEPDWSSPAGFQVDNTITLSSSKGHGKLVARLFSEGAAVDTGTLTLSRAALFAFRWGWVGLATFPRILIEATKLFFRRRLHIWYRPEVLRGSIGRRETRWEASIATVFETFINYRAKKLGIQLTYTNSLTNASKIGHRYDHNPSSVQKDVSSVQLHVNSPQFFTNYAADPWSIVQARCLPETERTFNIEGDFTSADIEQLFGAATDSSMTDNVFSKTWTTLELMRSWSRILERFRGLTSRTSNIHPMDAFAYRLAQGEAAEDSMSGPEKVILRTDTRLSERNHDFKAAGKQYRRAVRDLLASRLVLLGNSPEILDLVVRMAVFFVGWKAQTLVFHLLREQQQ